jgi:hypothetical protein
MDQNNFGILPDIICPIAIYGAFSHFLSLREAPDADDPGSPVVLL